METKTFAAVRLGAGLVLASFLLASAGCESGEKVVAPETSPQREAVVASAPTKAEQDSKPEEAAVPVVTAPVTVKSVDRWIEVEGSLNPYRRTRPAAEDSGRVASVNFEVGDTVKDGAVLVQLDDTIQRLEVTRDESAVEAGRLIAEERTTGLERAERELARVQAASEAGQASESELDEARMAAASLRAQVGQARADQLARESQLRASRKRLDRLTIKAPFSGVVVAKLTEMGGWLNAGDAAAEMIDTGTLELALQLPEPLLPIVKPAQSQVRVTIPLAGVAAETPVARAVREVDPATRMFPAWARLDNKDGILVPGMKVKCLVSTGEKVDAPTVPISAVVPGGKMGADFLFIVDNDHAVPYQIKSWYASGDLAVLASSPRDKQFRVVVQGQDAIGKRKVKVVERAASGKAEATPAPKLDSRKPE